MGSARLAARHISGAAVRDVEPLQNGTQPKEGLYRPLRKPDTGRMGLMQITVVGAGLAGCEAAWAAARQGVDVLLCEMKPDHYSPAHHSPDFAELVCSNSLRAARLETAAGLLKEEMRRLGSLIIACADETAVPAGGALAVDRERFSALVTKKILSNPHIRVENREVEQLPEGPCVIACGPLVAGALEACLRRMTAKACPGSEGELHFFDAAAPLVEADSVDREHAYFAARYGRGGDDYLNCPMDKEEYDAFWEALVTAETAPLRGFDECALKVFEGCMPVEIMAARGRDTLRFGPLKPVGLRDPRTGKDAYAVVQLRQDNAAASLYNMVGFQTHLKFPEQKRVFSMIPALREARFARYGVMHRNTYLNSPALLDRFYRLRSEPHVFFAGQVTGVEGYIESASSGLLAGINCARQARGLEPVAFPDETACGALACYISSPVVKTFEPMNVNFGIFAPLDVSRRIRDKQEKYRMLAERSLQCLEKLWAHL